MVYAAATINCAEANGWTRGEADAALGWSLERWKTHTIQIAMHY